MLRKLMIHQINSLETISGNIQYMSISVITAAWTGNMRWSDSTTIAAFIEFWGAPTIRSSSFTGLA